MGKGVAWNSGSDSRRCLQIMSRAASAARAPRRTVSLSDPSGVRIVNFPTKNHWRSPSRLADIAQGLDYFLAHAAEWEVRSVAFPPLGCGNGGLEWSEIGPLLYAKLRDADFDVEVYAPYGTPKQELTEEFLAAPSQMSLEGKGHRRKKFNPEWIVLVEVVRGLAQQPYANPVGRTILQKVAYVITEIGVETEFRFAKGSYGRSRRN